MSKIIPKNAKRNGKGQFIHGHSMLFIIGFWLASFTSLGLLWLAGRAVLSDLGSFRNCNSGTGILSVSSCGKQSLNPGDFILIGLFVLAAFFSFSLLTGAWRATRKGSVIV